MSIEHVFGRSPLSLLDQCDLCHIDTGRDLYYDYVTDWRGADRRKGRMRIHLMRRVLTRLHNAGIDTGDGSGIRLVKRYGTNHGLYDVPSDVLIRAAEHYRGLIDAGVLDKWETRDGEGLIRLAESDLIDQ